MKKFISIFIFLFIPSMVSAFNIHERLEFNLKWAGITAGKAVLEVKRDSNGRLKIISTANSADWVSKFYHVDDKVESILEFNSIKRSLLYRMVLKEGRHRRHKEYIFDYQLKRVSFINYLENTNEFYQIEGRIFDPLSAFYLVRDMQLKVGNSVFVPVFDTKRIKNVDIEKRVWNLEVKVLRKEKIETPLGVFNTIVIEPVMESEGVFSRSGQILIWLTDDDKKIPVLLKSKVTVGSIVAELIGGQY